MKLLFTLFGLILILEGLPYFTFPHAAQQWLRQISQIHPNFMRLLGFIALTSGFILCYLTQRTTLLG
ncbi:MAG: DUF2065 domain-containing protein [Desulfobacteraceae bacterium]|nr:DUF2065 domain-containing protein [Desulfobacteraceae bacterium]